MAGVKQVAEKMNGVVDKEPDMQVLDVKILSIHASDQRSFQFPASESSSKGGEILGMVLVVFFFGWLFARAARKNRALKCTADGMAHDPRLLPFDEQASCISAFFPIAGLWVLGLRSKYNRHAAVGDYETANECVRKAAKVKTWWFIPLVFASTIIAGFLLVALLILVSNALS